MNVTILAENLTFGGVSRYCLDLAEGLRAYPDVQVTLLALPDRRADWLLRAAETREVPVQVLPMRSTFDPSIIGRMRHWLRERQVDILHSQGYRSNLIARLAVRGGRLTTRLVCTVHGLHYSSAVSPRLRLFFMLDYLSMFTSDRVIAVSRDTCGQLMRRGLQQKTRVIHNGTVIPPPVDLEARRTSRQALGIAPHTKVVTFVGRLTHQKGPGALVDVARRMVSTMDNVVFLLVGDGPCMEDIRGCVQDLFPRVRLLGRQDDVTPFYTAADVLFMPSLYEGLPMTLIEAFAHGLPAVASRVGGVPEVIQDGVNGFLCEADQTAQMCERLEKILRDDALRHEMGAQARRSAETSFSIAQMCAHTYQLYRELDESPFGGETQ